MNKVVVVGCGVSGLSCAARLLEAGLDVEVWAREMPADTTSSVAAAVWYPYHAFPADQAVRWAMASYAEFLRLARDPAAGIELHEGIELLARAGSAPGWRTGLDGYREARGEELPAGYGGGWVTSAPVVEMPIYLPWLLARVRALGATVRERAVESLDEALAVGDVVVNCTGLASRELARDEQLVPIRGQVVRVERTGVSRFLFDEHHPAGPTYVVPRSADCVLGGTAEEGREDLTPDPATTDEIVARCAALEPRLAGARVLSVAVGLRPGRARVRLEAERVGSGGDKLVVHDYGHGGAGVTLSWGCADDVVALLRAATLVP